QGRLLGRISDVKNRQPVAGAKVTVLVQGFPGEGTKTVDAISDADGQYKLDLPMGHCNLWGVSPPAGYYIQDPKTYGAILTTPAAPRVIRDFVLQLGAPWHVVLRGVATPIDKPPFFTALHDPDSRMMRAGQLISATGNAQGKAILTIPPEGGTYRFNC